MASTFQAVTSSFDSSGNLLRRNVWYRVRWRICPGRGVDRASSGEGARASPASGVG